MTEKTIEYYQDRLTNIREVLNIMYNYAKKNNKNILNYIKSKFDYQLTQINMKILEDGLKLENLDLEFIRLSNRYIKILQFLHANKNQFIIAELKEESEVIEIEKLLNSIPKVPDTIPKKKSEIEEKLDQLPSIPTTVPFIKKKKKEPLLN